MAPSRSPIHLPAPLPSRSPTLAVMIGLVWLGLAAGLLGACSRPTVPIPDAASNTLVTPSAPAESSSASAASVAPTPAPSTPVPPTPVPATPVASTPIAPTVVPPPSEPAPTEVELVAAVHDRVMTELLVFTGRPDPALAAELTTGALLARLSNISAAGVRSGYESSAIRVAAIDEFTYRVDDCSREASAWSDVTQLRTSIVILADGRWKLTDFHTGGDSICEPGELDR